MKEVINTSFFYYDIILLVIFMKYIKVLIIIMIVLCCTGCKLTCVKMEHNENTDNTLRVIVNKDTIELNNSYKLNSSSIISNNKDELLKSIKEYVDDTYKTNSVIENDTVNMKLELNKKDDFFGSDLDKYNYFELYKYFEEKGYTCR